jgi:uncharacterized damage-inducible protein DinB
MVAFHDQPTMAKNHMASNLCAARGWMESAEELAERLKNPRKTLIKHLNHLVDFSQAWVSNSRSSQLMGKQK